MSRIVLVLVGAAAICVTQTNDAEAGRRKRVRCNTGYVQQYRCHYHCYDRCYQPCYNPCYDPCRHYPSGGSRINQISYITPEYPNYPQPSYPQPSYPGRSGVILGGGGHPLPPSATPNSNNTSSFGDPGPNANNIQSAPAQIE